MGIFGIEWIGVECLFVDGDVVEGVLVEIIEDGVVVEIFGFVFVVECGGFLFLIWNEIVVEVDDYVWCVWSDIVDMIVGVD